MRDNPQGKCSNLDVFEVAKGKHCCGGTASDKVFKRRKRAPGLVSRQLQVYLICIKSDFSNTTKQSFCVKKEVAKWQL